MCGIVGIISKRANGLFMKDLDNFEAMLVTDTQRGLDSTGVFSAHVNGDVNIIKVATHPLNLFLTSEWAAWRNKAMATAKFVVGHNRKATQGAVNSENAHPFAEGDYVLIHNGTLRNHHKWKTGKEVDSHALCVAFNEKGHEAAIAEIEGAFALVFYHIVSDKLYMIRNTERPLSLVIGTEIISFASESWMAEGQMMRSNQKIESIITLEPSVLYEFGDKGEFTSKKINLFKETPSVYYPVGRSRWPYNDYDDDMSALGGTVIQQPVSDTTSKILQPFADSNLFPKGRVVQAQVSDLKMEWNMKLQANMWKITGFINHPQLPKHDCIGYLPINTVVTHKDGWKNALISGVVDTVWRTVCGPSVNLIDIELDELIQVHGDKVGAVTYRHLVQEEPCSGCYSPLTWREAAFTGVSFRKDQAICLCPDCLENKLKGTFKDDFIQKRSAAAVQDGKQQRQGTDEHAESIILVPSPSSLQ